MDKLFKEVKNQINFVDLEHDIIKFWEENDIFNKLVQQNKNPSTNPAPIQHSSQK